MILKLHIWIGNPQSVRELDVLTDALGRSVPLPRGDVTVICEAHEMPIHDLAARLTKSPSMQREVQNLGGHLRAGTATAMFGIEAEALSLKEETPSGLTYLGSLSMSEQVGSAEVKMASRPGYSFLPNQTVAFASDLCLGPDRKPVRYMRRDEFFLTLNNHTGWILFSGEESAEEFAGPSRFKRVSLSSFIRDDPSLGPLIDWPVGSEWTRSGNEHIWRRIVNNQVVDETGRVIGHPRETHLRSAPNTSRSV